MPCQIDICNAAGQELSAGGAFTDSLPMPEAELHKLHLASTN